MVATPSTQQRLLAAAIEQVERGGEQSIRLNDIARAGGVSVASIYHFFGNRDGLVEAAQLARYSASLTELNEEFVERVKASRSHEQFLGLVRGAFREAISDERSVKRATRIEVLGFARQRPSLSLRVAQVHGEVVRHLAKAVQFAQVRGWCRRDLDSEALGAWILTAIDGRYLVEMDPEHGDLRAWNSVAEDAVLAVSGNPPVGLHSWQASTVARRPTPRRLPDQHGDGWRLRRSTDDLEEGAISTRLRLLKAAAAQVASGGEQALRVREVAAAAGVTQPSVYHFFGSREGLLIEVQAGRYSTTQKGYLESFGDSVAGCRTRREFVATIRRHLELTNRPERVGARADRMEVLGSALTRPELAARLVDEQRTLNRQLAAGLELAQERGWIRPDLDTYLFAAWVLGQILAREMVPGRLAHMAPQWGEIVIAAVTSASGNPPRTLARGFS